MPKSKSKKPATKKVTKPVGSMQAEAALNKSKSKGPQMRTHSPALSIPASPNKKSSKKAPLTSEELRAKINLAIQKEEADLMTELAAWCDKNGCVIVPERTIHIDNKILGVRVKKLV